MKCYKVENIVEYLELLEDIADNKKLWFRGQSNSKYRLTPGILRDAVAVSDWAGREIQVEKANLSNGKGEKVHYPNCWNMLSKFKEDVKDIIDFELKNDLEWLCLAQHYGIPTPLLDWTTDPLVALFFAIDGVSYDDSTEKLSDVTADDEYEYLTQNISESSPNTAAVFIIDPIKINEAIPARNWKSRLLDIHIDEEGIENLMDSEVVVPFCIMGEKNDRRICRQSGNFTVHSRLTYPVDFVEAFRKDMIKIMIPYRAVDNIRKSLKVLDLTSESIYFGIDEKDLHAKEIALKHVNEFKQMYSEAF